MKSGVWKKLLALALALALVLPPLSGILHQAFDGDGSHVHFDHVWHQPSLDDILNPSRHDAGQKQGGASETHQDHVHIAVMAIVAGNSFELILPDAAYDPVEMSVQFGRVLSPPGRPPQLIS